MRAHANEQGFFRHPFLDLPEFTVTVHVLLEYRISNWDARPITLPCIDLRLSIGIPVLQGKLGPVTADLRARDGDKESVRSNAEYIQHSRVGPASIPDY